MESTPSIAYGKGSFLTVILPQQTYSFLHEDNTYSDPGAIATIMGLFNPLLRAFSIMSRTLSLRNSLAGDINSGASQKSADDIVTSQGEANLQANQTVQECFKMLDEFHVWDEDAAEHWRNMFKSRTVPTTLGQVAHSQVYYDTGTACTIILMRSARLILLWTLLLYSTKIHFTDDGEYGRQNILDHNTIWAEFIPVLEQDLRTTIDDLLSSVPYALGDISPAGLPSSMPHDGAGAIVIVHPVRLVSVCVYATPAQVQRAKGFLARINRNIGIRSAVGGTEGLLATPRWENKQPCRRSVSTVDTTISTLALHAEDHAQGGFDCLV